MLGIKKLRQRIAAIISKEEAKVRAEIEEFKYKQYGNEQVYGCGGWYTQYEKAINRRREYLEDLEALSKAQGRAVTLEKLRLYPFCCPSCQITVNLDDNRVKNYMNNTIDCPICTRPIYRAAKYVEYDVEKGSKYTHLK